MTVRVSSDFSINRANIQTGCTPYAAQHLLKFIIRQDTAATIIQDYQVKFIRTINLA